MKRNKQRYFLPGEIDEQIEQYLEPHYPEQATNVQENSPAAAATQKVIQGLQGHFAPSRDTSERVRYVWQRLERRRLELDTQSVGHKKHLAHQITDLSQRRETQLSKHLSLTDGSIASSAGKHFSILSTLIAVACAILIVSGAIFTLQRLRPAQNHPAANSTLANPTTLTETSGIYTYTILGEYYKLDSATHKELWHFIVPQNNQPMSRSSPPIVKNGLLYMLNVGNDGYDIYALNTTDGSIKWKTRALSSVEINNLSVVGQRDFIVTNDMFYYVVFSISDGYSIIHALSAETGKEVWHTRYDGAGILTGDAPNNAPEGMWLQSATNNTLYATTLTGFPTSPIMKLYAIDLQNNGQLRWSTSIPFSDAGVSDLHGTTLNGTLYYGGPSTGTIYGYDTHQVQQKLLLPANGLVTSLVEANGILYVGTSHQNAQGVYDAGSVYALRPQDGKVLWQYTNQGNGGGSIPTVRNGTVYVTFAIKNNVQNTPLTVVALDATNGHLRWSREIPNGAFGPIQPLAGSKFLYLAQANQYNPQRHQYNTIVTLLNLSNGSTAGNFTPHSNLGSETLSLVVVP